MMGKKQFNIFNIKEFAFIAIKTTDMMEIEHE
jgi:hypothetical protein